MKKKIGDNKHGNKNEISLSKSLNRKRYKDLNTNLKKFVDYIADCKGISINAETLINARYERDNHLKQDFYVSIDHIEFGVSLKMGEGNSTHQEKCEDFINYLINDCNVIDKSVLDDIRILIWCDGTTNGTGKPADRLTAKEYINKYLDGYKRVKDLLKQNEESILRRDLLVGRHNSQVDFIYHGTKDYGKWTSADTIIEYNLKKPLDDSKKKALLRIGRITMQVYSRNDDKRRGQLQIKYGSMKKDFDEIMTSESTNIGTFEGNSEEYNISEKMNKDKNHIFWKKMGLIDNSDLYVVRVTKKVNSIVAGKKVNPKSDAYIIKCDLSETFLLENEYALSEEAIKNLQYEILDGTGISVKRKLSKSYTYQKFRFHPFVNATKKYLDEPEILFVALNLFCQDKEDTKLNKNIIKELNIDKEQFIEYFKKKLKRERLSYKSLKGASLIRKTAEKIFSQAIDSNEDLSMLIFTGKGNFPSPYYANYMYKSGNLTDNCIPEKYKISNGSGRHKGIYTITIKP